ncbi:MAG TPA: histidinol-phosphatase HisJ family protein [Clostridiales bacterium]|nr:histidinol-phosphatase HisJ family protein [Clostridiales bacterium]
MSLQFKYVSENHCHSSCSFDAADSVDAMCLQAIKLGLYSITITDHCEVNGYANPQDSEFGDFSQRIPQAIIEMKQAQKKYKDKIKLYRGIELGQPLQDLESADTALALDDFDFVLASVHNIKDTQDFYWLHYTQDFAYEILGKYFSELLQTARWNKFDSLSHLTYPLRYITGRDKINIDLHQFRDVTDEILLTLIHNNKALEINTSGLRQDIKCTMPDGDIIARYKELGGKYLTIGSDAHSCHDLGKGLEQGLAIAKGCGFHSYTIFDKHIPKLIPIE